MKYLVRVEPPLMFNINRTREHDVKEAVPPIGRRRNRKGGEQKEGITAREEDYQPKKQLIIILFEIDITLCAR